MWSPWVERLVQTTADPDARRSRRCAGGSRSGAWSRARRSRPRSCTSRRPTTFTTGADFLLDGGITGVRIVGSMSPAEPLRVALVGGPMYDHLYARLHAADVEVVVHADHPTLNRRVAELLGAGERIDVLATHSKYAPSQRQWLRPLDDLLAPERARAARAAAVELCRFEGALLCAPRLVDVRVLWVAHRPGGRGARHLGRAARVATSSSGSPGRESGLFGTFFELVVGAGGALFDDDLRPTMATPEAEWAVDALVPARGARAGRPPRVALRRRRRRAARRPGRRGRGVARRLGRDPDLAARGATSQPFRYPAGAVRARLVLGLSRVGDPDHVRRRRRARSRSSPTCSAPTRRRLDAVGRQHVRPRRRARRRSSRRTTPTAAGSRSPAPRSTPR